MTGALVGASPRRQQIMQIAGVAAAALVMAPVLQLLHDNTPGPRCVDCNGCVGHLGAQPADCYHPTVRAEKDAMLAGE